MICPNPRCKSTKVRTQRTVHPHTEGEYPSRFLGINGIKRVRYCGDCDRHWNTLELPEGELDAAIARGSLQPLT